MPRKGLEERGRSLEEAFFQKEEERSRELLRLRREEEEAKEALAEACDITDTELLARLAGLGIRAETLAALTLVPLVEVAWADGKMEERERAAILQGAESSGVEPGSPSHGLLEIWTRDRPAAELMDSWRAYIEALCAELSADQRWHLEDRIVGRARAVAEAAGGFLGIGPKVSPAEEAVLEAMRSAFRGPPRA